jgi:hypothetical protein
MQDDAKPEIHSISVQIKPPGPGLPAGQRALCTFTFVNDTVTLCHPTTGEPARDPQGKTYTRKLQPPTNTFADATEHARLLTVDLRRALTGGRPRGFGGPGGNHRGPIVYPKHGYF